MNDKPHRRLLVWQAAVELVTKVYKHTRTFPQAERYALVAQMRRAAASIPSNIAEGAARKGRKEYVQFLHTARGSLSELDTQLEIAFRLGYLNERCRAELQSQLDCVGRMLSGLISSLNH